MAKKRRQKVEKKDDYDFKLPDFDEHQFMALELKKTKVSLIAFIFAIVMVIITFQLYTVTHPDARGPAVVGIFSVVALPFLTKLLKIDTNDFDWKNWFGSGAIYVLSWLAIFILVCNPPFSDFIEPEINDESVKLLYIKSGDEPNNWTLWNTSDEPPSLKFPVKIRVDVEVKDNTGVNKDSVKITIGGLKNNTVSDKKMIYVSENIYRLDLDNNGIPFKSQTYEYTIKAEDIYGHKTEYVGEFQIP